MIIRGVSNNTAIGTSILRNPQFEAGKYTAEFVPSFYPNGFKGEPLTTDDHYNLALAAHFLKNKKVTQQQLPGLPKIPELKTTYATLNVEGHPVDYKIEKLENG